MIESTPGSIEEVPDDEVEGRRSHSLTLIPLVDQELSHVVGDVRLLDVVGDHHEPNRRLVSIETAQEIACAPGSCAASARDSGTVLTNLRWPGRDERQHGVTVGVLEVPQRDHRPKIPSLGSRRVEAA